MMSLSKIRSYIEEGAVINLLIERDSNQKEISLTLKRVI